MPHPVSDAAPLVLGSGSPRRREILTQLKIPHVVRAADADERLARDENVEAYLPRIVAAKLAAVRAAHPAMDAAAVILVADTAVVDGGDILGKPASAEEAQGMVERLSGRTHAVHTRFLLAPIDGGDPLHAETVVTRVSFRALGVGEARAYALGGEGRDKAGGYAVQGAGAAFVARIDGSYGNVVGLPPCELVMAMRRLGLW